MLRIVLLIAAAALASHGLLLLNNGVFWDSWLLLPLLTERDAASLVDWFTQMGNVSMLVTHAPFMALGSTGMVVVAYRLAAVGAMIAIAAFAAALARRVGGVTRTEAAWIGALACSYPAYQVHVELVMLPYVTCYAALLGGALVAIRSECASGTRHAALRVAAILLFLYSFGINSLLVFYGGAAALMVLFWRRKEFQRSWPSFFAWVALHRIDYVLAPIVYWYVARRFLVPYGFYKGYNEVVIETSRLRGDYGVAFDIVVSGVLQRAWATLLGHPWIPALALALTVGLALRKRPTTDSDRLPSARDAAVQVAVGVLLFLVGLFPYLVVGKIPAPEGWNSRHALLVGLPAALVVVGIATPLLRSSQRTMRAVANGCLLLLLGLFARENVSQALAFQGRWLKDSAIVHALRTEPALPRLSIVRVDDQTPRLYGEPYRFFEWAALFREVLGRETVVGIGSEDDLRFLQSNRHFLHHLFATGAVDLDGCGGRMTIVPGLGWEPYGALGMRHFQTVFRPAAREALYRSLIEVRLEVADDRC